MKKQIIEYQRYVEENEMLRSRYDELVYKCEKLDEECGLYDRDREALMEFGNEAEERAREAEARSATAEEKAGKLVEELEFYKRECESLKVGEILCTFDCLVFQILCCIWPPFFLASNRRGKPKLVKKCARSVKRLRSWIVKGAKISIKLMS